MVEGQDQGAPNSSRLAINFTASAPTISLPKGGVAVRGIGEKFATNPVTGTGSMSVPIATSPGRSGFGPQLSLSYDSGAGDGPFGFGWSLSISSITRKTDKGLPEYSDAEETDIFILSGAEDLVPILEPDGTRFKDDTTVPGYVIYRYRPRVEGLFARIERWTRQSDGDIHWRSFSKDNVLTLYGKGANSRFADPVDPERKSRIFTWLICETRDDKGNAVVYDYKSEDGKLIDLAQAHERNRSYGDDKNRLRSANRYLKRIKYGNRLSLLDNEGRRPLQLEQSQFEKRPLDVRGRLRLRRTRPRVAEADRRTPVDAPAGPLLHIPGRFRGAHLSTLPAGADVSPLPRGRRYQRRPPRPLRRAQPDLFLSANDQARRLQAHAGRQLPLPWTSNIPTNATATPPSGPKPLLGQ